MSEGGPERALSGNGKRETGNWKLPLNPDLLPALGTRDVISLETRAELRRRPALALERLPPRALPLVRHRRVRVRRRPGRGEIVRPSAPRAQDRRLLERRRHADPHAARA